MPWSLDALSPEPAPGTGALIGLEQEFRVVDAVGRPRDFRTIVDALALDGRQLDPGDVHAWRLSTGAVITADGDEAEIATPPLDVESALGGEVHAHLAAAQAVLVAALPTGWRLEGYSTHVSLSKHGAEDEAALAFARTVGLAYAWLVESPASLGIYIRPRPGRLELCSDFAAGGRLEACIALAVAALRALDSGAAVPALSPTLLPGVERFGYRLHRTASFGFDAYEAPRTLRLTTPDGNQATGQDYLIATWEAISPFVPGNGSEVLLEVADGRRPLGVEREWTGLILDRHAAPPATIDGDILRPRVRAGLTVEALLSTWWATVFRVRTGAGARLVAVPRAFLAGFLSALDRGQADAALCAAVDRTGQGRHLVDFASIVRPAAWDTVDPSALLPPERAPSGDAPSTLPGLRPGKLEFARPGKQPNPAVGTTQVTPPPPPPQPLALSAMQPRPRGRALLVAGVVLALLAAIVSGLVALAGDDSPPIQPTPSPRPSPAQLETATWTASPAQSPTSTQSPPPSPTMTPTSRPQSTSPAIPSPTATGTPTRVPLDPTATPDGGQQMPSTPSPTARPTNTPLPTISANSPN